ncbi:peptidoglycan-binding domain-containing protein [Aureivirga marina]|uniref:peptidoglycan-binding domain-containing protein n=1 Tax=Aureivirga marina TaxID=1182451 RepID=UPI0018C97C8A|nr:hypothetical protein [Aureivirga marina]
MTFSREYPSYDFLNSKDAVSKIASFESLVEKASDEGVISDLPKDESETYDYAKQRIRIQTIATRLYLLGYLNRKLKLKEGKENRRRLRLIKEAVGKFQQECDLKQDFWVGEQTWNALDELVSFESEMNEKFWFDGEEIKDSRKFALHRALQLRLWALGLHDDEPNKRFKLLEFSDLNEFIQIQDIFLFKKTFEVGLNKSTVLRIFNQDYITQQIARRVGENKDSFYLNAKTNESRKLGKKFIINTLKVELWLLGFDVSIDGIDDYEYEEGGKLFLALKKFYIRFKNKSTTEAHELAMKMQPFLFSEIDAINHEDSVINEEELCEDVVSEMNTHEKINTMWETIKDKGTRLWDGIKRIWRAIRRVGKKILDFFVNNIYKAFLNFATKSFHYLKNGIKAIVQSISNYVKGRLEFENCTYVFRKDLDTQIFISENIREKEANKIVYAIQYQTKAFQVGCKIISFVIQAIRKFTMGIFGWARFLYVLVKKYKDIKAVMKDFHFLATNPL